MTISGPIIEAVDVLVVGGGTAGVIAAIQAGRTGASVAVLEAGSQLGGTMTTGGVCAPALFYAGRRQVIAGIGWELVQRTVAMNSDALPDFQNPPPTRPSYHVGINPGLYALLAEEAALAAGVRLHYYEFPVAVTATRDGWSVDSVGRGGVRRILAARELIDCTGDAAVCALLGLERLRGDERQPGTLEFRLEGYDAAALDETEVERRYQAALASGELRPGDFCYRAKPFTLFLKWGGFNLLHVFGADSSTAVTQTEANIAGRQGVLRLLRFVRALPGCDKARLRFLCTETAVRETWRILGETVITRDDYLAGRVFPDAVGYSMYFVDLHTHEGTAQEFLAPGVVPTLPLSALIPKGSRRLLVAGRTVSSDRAANSGLRVEASCMAMGQAAGAAAALAARSGCASRDVPVEAVRELLSKHGAILPPATN